MNILLRRLIIRFLLIFIGVIFFGPLFNGIEVFVFAQKIEPIKIAVSLPPQKEFVKKVGGERVTVEVILKPGQSHHTYEPTARDLVSLEGAKLYFRIGIPFEDPLIPRLKTLFPQLVFVETQVGMENYLLPPDSRHGSFDPHVWMDPRLVKQQIAIISSELRKVDPSHSLQYQMNEEAYRNELDFAHEQIRILMEPHVGKPLYVFHPAYGYFCAAYGLKQVPLEVDGKEPGPRQLAQFLEEARRDQVKMIVVQPQFPSRSVEMIAETLQAEILVLDPLAEKYLENLLSIARKIAEGLERKP